MTTAVETQTAVHGLVRNRWSPREFSNEPVTGEELTALLEAARLAPSSYNEQPWRLIVVRRDDPEAFQRFLSILMPANQAWARAAQVLILSVAKTTFTHNGVPNRHAWHDVGLAAANLSLQATALGLGVHQMGGYDTARARAVFGIPADFEPVAAIAVGRPASARDDGNRGGRKPLEEVAFEAEWGRPWRA